MARQFNATPAERQAVNLILGLAGPSSSGKTYTALELATGIQSVVGGDIDVIDTEHGRALFYADAFKFNHVPFDAPFASLDYLEAIQQSAKRGAKVIVADSMSHEHEGIGGMIDFQEAEVERMAGSDYGKRERVKMLAWQKPKAARRRLLQGLTQIDAHLILCFRAKQTSKPAKDDRGKNVVVPMGFVPIAGEEFVFEAALSMLFHPNSGGVPTWNPDLPGERIAVKLPAQFGWLKDHRGPVDQAVGAKLAQWAVGGSKVPRTESPTTHPTATIEARADKFEAALRGSVDLETLTRTWRSAVALRDILEAQAPKRHAELVRLHTRAVELIAEHGERFHDKLTMIEAPR